MIYVFMADGTEEIEALTPVDVLRRGGLEVRTVGIGGKTVTGSHQIPLVCDLTPQEVDMQKIEMLVLPGGMPGTNVLDASPDVQRFLDFAQENSRWIAAICAAPSILGRRGMLRGRKAVCFPGFEKELAGAEVCNQPVCMDGKLITGKGMGAALPFALKLLEVLTDKDTAQSMAETLQCGS